MAGLRLALVILQAPVCFAVVSLGFQKCHCLAIYFYRDSVGCDKFRVFSGRCNDTSYTLLERKPYVRDSYINQVNSKYSLISQRVPSLSGVFGPINWRPGGPSTKPHAPHRRLNDHNCHNSSSMTGERPQSQSTPTSLAARTRTHRRGVDFV